MSVTQQDIAKAAGVSRGTVDRVLHNRPNVSEAIREKVLRAADALGYQKQKQAPSEISCSAAILIPRWSDSYFNRKIHSGMMRAILQLDDPSFLLREHMLESHASRETVRAIREELEAGAQGLILRPENVPEVREAIEAAVRAGVRVVTYDSDLPDSGRLCYIGQDAALSGRIAAGFFAKLLRPDAQLLIVVGNMYLEVHRQRVDAFSARMKELGFATRNLHIAESGELFDLTEDLVLKELKRNPQVDGVYMATEPVSSCVSGIRKARLPKRPFVVCNDLTPTTRRYLRNGDVDYVIDQPFEQKSYRAILSMYHALRSGAAPRHGEFFTGSYIVTREMVI